jgi:SAM-dependent methyltransferase
VESRDVRRNGYLRRLNSSHLRSSELGKYVDLPVDLEGTAVLEIGAGTSTSSMDLAERGARVIALDLRFRSLEELRGSSLDYFKCFKTNLKDPLLRRRHPLLEQVYESDHSDAARFFRDVVGKASGVYVAGDLFRLPFGDSSFDLAYSVRCLSDYYVDADLFVEAVHEALRVVKPGGSVQISPWQDDYLSLGRGMPIGASAGQQAQALSRLRSDRLVHQVKAARESGVGCLVVTKPILHS